MSSPLARRGYVFLIAGLGLPALGVGLTGCGPRVAVKPSTENAPIPKTDPRAGRTPSDTDEGGYKFRGPDDLSNRLENLVKNKMRDAAYLEPPTRTPRGVPNPPAIAEAPTPLVPRHPKSPQPAPVQPPAAEPDAAGMNTQVAITPPAPAPVQPPPAAPVKPASAPVGNDGQAFGSANTAVTASTTIGTSSDKLQSRLDQYVRDYPTNLSGHIDQQLLKLIRDEQVPSVEQWGQLSPEDRELLSALCDGLTGIRVAIRSDPNALRHKKIRPLLEMADRIREQAELTIPTIALCSEVRGFGVYKPMENTFRAGQDREVLLYCEVANFSSRQNGNLLWETKLSEEVVLYTETGFPVWRDKKPIGTDESRNRRHDFYVFKRLTLPHTLSVGRYVMKATIVDEQAKRIAENSLTINLVAQ